MGDVTPDKSEEREFIEVAMRMFDQFARAQVVRINLGEAFDPKEWATHWTLIATRAYIEVTSKRSKS